MMVGLKKSVRGIIIRAANSFKINSKYIGTPKGWSTVSEWTSRNSQLPGVSYTEIIASQKNEHRLPVTIDGTIHKIYTGNASWQQNKAFVASIPKGRVWGRNGAVITPDDFLLEDVSREFGKYGGVFNKEHSIFKQIKLASVKKLKGTVAVVAAAGSTNYHHWLYDTVPRLGLLKKAGLLDKIDHFVIGYTGLPFQKESLEAIGIDNKKIVTSNDNWKFHIEADLLIIPSLPAHLGTISAWTPEFLRSVFLSDPQPGPKESYNIYLSRKKAPTRKLINEETFFDQILKPLNFIEFFAEDHSIRETARVFANARYIIGVHGSGFANLVFCSPDAKIIDIVAPRHIDAYYWLLADYCRSGYGYIFGVGDRAREDEDLVQSKIDQDIQLDIEQFKSLMQKMQIN